MSALKLKTAGLARIAAQFNNPEIKEALLRLPQERAMGALVGQAIAENFDQEGPGWAPLKAETIRRSVKGKKLRAELANMSDEEILEHERKARKKESEELPHRAILQKTGLLRNTATKPGYTGSSKSGKRTMTGSNIFKTEGTKLIWGTDLIYAKTHNEGDPKRGIPQREFMKLSKTWEGRIKEYFLERAFKVIRKMIGGNK